MVEPQDVFTLWGKMLPTQEDLFELLHECSINVLCLFTGIVLILVLTGGVTEAITGIGIRNSVSSSL